MIDETVREIEDMETQSASIVAVKAARALRDLLDREYPSVTDFTRAVRQNSQALHRANDSHAPLFTSQQFIVSEVTEPEPETVEAGKQRLREAIDQVITEMETNKERAAETAADLIEDGGVVLTHENSSTVMATFDAALKAGKEFDVYVTESRPRLLGRKTARKLAEREGVDPTLIVDSAAGHFMPEVDQVLLGMNCLLEDVVYNRIGTYPIAVTAADNDVPVRFVASSSKFIGGGFDFENNHRSPMEVTLEPPDEFAVANPGYDATPTRLVHSVVTEDGVIKF